MSWPAPFTDTTTDRRSEAQRDIDRAAAAEQSRQIAEWAEAETVDSEFFGLMRDRRAEVDGAVQLEVAPTRTRQQTLVVRGELLVRTTGRDDDVEIRNILAEFGIIDQADPKRDAGGETAAAADTPEEPGDGAERDAAEQPAEPDTTALAVDARSVEAAGQVVLDCPELAPYLTRYVAREVGVGDRLQAVERLAEIDVPAALTSVTALQAKPYQIVVKAATGPSPTTVEDPAVHYEVTEHKSKRRVLVAVIDTGIVEERREDGWLNDVERLLGDNIDPLDVFPPGESPTGGNGFLDFGAGHGTFAAGIVRQVEPLADIRVYSALDSDGLGSELGLACAMIRAVKDGAEVINLSVGIRTVDNDPPLAIDVALDVIDALTECREAPVFVAAAGNFGDRVPVWPAASRRVISVAGLTTTGPAPWSSRGPWVDCSTIAEGIVSTFVKGTEDPAFDPREEQYPAVDPRGEQSADAWAVWTGTSFAAPQVAGAIARTMRETGLSPRAAARRVIRAGSPIPEYGRALTILPGT